MQNLFAMVQNHIGLILLILCALLILCSALLFVVLLRQKNLQRRLSDQSATERMTQQLLSALQQQDARINEQFQGQQQIYLHTSAESSRQTEQRMEALNSRLDVISQSQEARLHRISATLDERLAANDQHNEQLRTSLSTSLDKLQKDNAEKLEKMRLTVDEKLHETLNRRLGESFSLVNERLEQVYKGLGEMHTLANGVGDLKRVLSNVKSRGIWGEVQLGTLLSQMLTPSQYDENVKVAPNTNERVEFAIRLPGANDEHPLYLPIDSKFPMEDYERLLSASEAGDAALITEAANGLAKAIRVEAARIAKKYITPPYTTDFAVMFLSTEGLYAEALRCRGLIEELQQKHHILVAGPSTLSALLSSLQVGFRTLAIEQRSAEVWHLLGAVKTEFVRFSDLLDQTQQRLRQAGESIEKAAAKTRTITRRLRDVEALDSDASMRLLNDDVSDSQ